jgi:hypothetical protein
MSIQRSSWPSTWPSANPAPTPAEVPATPARAVNPPGRPTPPVVRPPQPTAPPAPNPTRGGSHGGGHGAGAPGAPPPAALHLTNNAVLSDLARQARTARAELQAAQEAFSRKALGLMETLRIVDDSMVQLATHVLGNSVIAAAWFSSRNHHMAQRSPLEVLMVGDRDAVVNELLRIEHGVY